VFQGAVVENSWRLSLSGDVVFDDRVGHGRVCIGSDGLPVTLIWAMVPTLVPTVSLRPPRSPVFGLMHHQICNTVARENKRGQACNSSRKIRSAASMWCNMDMQLCHPAQAMRDHKRRSFLTHGTVPTDSMMAAFLNGGMARRMGAAVKTSFALNHVHAPHIDMRFEELFLECASHAD